MSELKPAGKKTNHKKGIAARAKLKRRTDAEARNAAYQKLPLEEKMARNSNRVRVKLGAAS